MANYQRMRNESREVGIFLTEKGGGNSIEDAAKEFRYSRGTIKKRIEELKWLDPKLYYKVIKKIYKDTSQR